jgi:phosphoglycolate phosphatase-like HAD superfamily hydrolase
MTTIAYDLDGTLVSIKNRQVSLLISIAKSYGITLNQDILWPAKQNGSSNLELLYNLRIQEDLSQLICKDWEANIETNFWLTQDVTIQDRILEIKRLRYANHKVLLITARRSEYNLRQQLLNLGINTLFDEVYCVQPSEKVFQKSSILQSTNTALFIGDTETDFKSAKNAGVKFVGVSSGQRSYTFLVKCGVELIDQPVIDLIPQ